MLTTFFDGVKNGTHARLTEVVHRSLVRFGARGAEHCANAGSGADSDADSDADADADADAGARGGRPYGRAGARGSATPPRAELVTRVHGVLRSTV